MENKPENYITWIIELNSEDVSTDNYIPILGNGGLFDYSYNFFSLNKSKISRIILDSTEINLDDGKINQIYYPHEFSIFCIPIKTTGKHEIKIYFNNLIDNLNCSFSSCFYYTELDFSNFNSSKVKDMSHMFHHCKKLRKINFANFNTSELTSMRCMFSFCI